MPLGPSVDLTRSVSASAPIVESCLLCLLCFVCFPCLLFVVILMCFGAVACVGTNELCAVAAGLLCVALDDAHGLVRLAANHVALCVRCFLCSNPKILHRQSVVQSVSPSQIKKRKTARSHKCLFAFCCCCWWWMLMMMMLVLLMMTMAMRRRSLTGRGVRTCVRRAQSLPRRL